VLHPELVEHPVRRFGAQPRPHVLEEERAAPAKDLIPPLIRQIGPDRGERLFPPDAPDRGEILGAEREASER
jgi:hypothetical protein